MNAVLRMNDPRSDDAATPKPASGVELASIVLGSGLTGLGVGYALDQWLGSSPKAILICFLVFMAAGIYHLIKVASK